MNIPGEYVTPLVELTVGFMVCLFRDIVDRAQGLRAGQPVGSHMGSRLRGHVLGIVGLGDIGGALRNGWTARAARDVFANEPKIIGNPLIELPDVITTRKDYAQLMSFENCGLDESRPLQLMARRFYIRAS